MKTSLHWAGSFAPKRDGQPPWFAQLKNAWQNLLVHLDATSEPRVWSTPDGLGGLVWNAYDPISGQSVYQLSEADMRVWLEELHYHDQDVADAKRQQLKFQSLT